MPFVFATGIVYPSGGGGGGGSAPDAPTGLNATAGDGEVSLTWNTVSGASTYRVKRGTSSGSHPTTLTSSVTTGSYTDSSAVNGTHYYYVVYAINSYGTSAASAEDDATPAASGGGALVSITNQQIDQIGSGISTAGYRLNTNGNAEAKNVSAYSTLEVWKLSGATSDYVAYVTYTGDAPSGSATSTEVALTGSPSWSVSAANGTSKTCDLTVQIRNASTHAVLDTALVGLYSERDDS